MNAHVMQLGFDEIEEGYGASFEVFVDGAAIDAFAALSGDVSTLHVDDDFARSRGFSGRVVHGAYLGALVSRLIGTALPGENALVHSTQLAFHAPAYVGDTLSVAGRVDRKADAVRALIVSVTISRSGPRRSDRPLASGKIQVGFTA